MTTSPTSTPTAERLYALLPTIHRVRDAENDYVLRELVQVLADQVDVLDEELAQLYDDLFVETCADWATPYVGDLVGYRPLHGEVPAVASPRAEVANTIAYRRRKGTAAVLEQLAFDVTGWPARVVEFFERLASTQYMNHVRPHAMAAADLHNTEGLAWLTEQNGAFDNVAHSADVRRIAADRPALRGRHNIPNIGIFLWRTEAVPVTRSPLVAHATDGRRFRFDALGADAPLFAAPRTEDAITHLAEPFDVPMPLSRRWLSAHRDAYYGRPTGFLIETGAPLAAVTKDHILVSDLSDDPGGSGDWVNGPSGDDVAVDPVLGRVYFGTALAAGNRGFATYFQGMAVPVGAGASSRKENDGPLPLVSQIGGASLMAKLNGVAAGGTLELQDSAEYSQSVTIKAITPAGADPAEVWVMAAEAQRPSIVANGPVRLVMDPGTTVVLDGLLISGGPLVLDEVGDRSPRTIVLRNCTVVPGHTRTGDGLPGQPSGASLVVLDPFAQVVVERSALGPIVAVEGSTVKVTDSVIDASSRGAVAYCGRPVPAGGGLRSVGGVADQDVGDGTTPGGLLDVHESTVVGGIHCTQLDAANSLLIARLETGDPRKAAVHARRRQVGCVRFSYVPLGSRTGKRFRCQPDPADPADVQAAIKPRFTSMRYGEPAYLQLTSSTTPKIRRGADDESEMGATHQLYTPQREANLLLRLDEYLRFGLEASFFYAT